MQLALTLIDTVTTGQLYTIDIQEVICQWSQVYRALQTVFEPVGIIVHTDRYVDIERA